MKKKNVHDSSVSENVERNRLIRHTLLESNYIYIYIYISFATDVPTEGNRVNNNVHHHHAVIVRSNKLFDTDLILIAKTIFQ